MLVLHLLKPSYMSKGLIGLLLISLVACGSDTSVITFPEDRPEPLVDVLPETLALSGQAGEEVSEQLELKNERAQSISFAASSTRDWLSVTPAKGSLASDASVVLTLSAKCPDEPASFSSIFSLDTGNDYPKELAVTLQCEGGTAEDTAGNGVTDGSDAGGADDSATDGSDGDEADDSEATDGSDETTGTDGSDTAEDADGTTGEDATTDGADTGSEDGAETDTTTGTDADGGEETTDGSEDADGDTGADGEETTDGADEGGAEDTGSEDTGSEDTGSEDTGSEDTGSEDTGADDGDADTDGTDDGSDTGEPVPQAELADLNPTELSLSAVAEESVPASISFSNAGDAVLEYALLQTSKESWLSFTDAAGTLAPGESATLDIVATCGAQAQTLSGFLELETNDLERPMTPIALELVCSAPSAQDVSLSISAEGSSGRVVSEPAGIDCLGGEGTCSAAFAGGTPVSLTAQAEQASAQFMGWLSGPCAGEFGATCELVLEDDLNVAVNFTETSPSTYNISFHFLDASFNASQRAAFESAAQRWTQVLDTDLRDVSAAEAEDPAGCGTGAAYKGDIDDLVISVAGVQIDGPDGLLAEAGPCWLRPENGLPYLGVLNIDLADLSDLETSGKLAELILHEMGHVLGIGTLWNSLGLISYDTPNCNAATEVSYTGGSAYNEFLAYGGSGLLAVEEEGGRGVKCYHWDEAQFQSELMTGYFNFSGGNPMSRMTVGSLQDIGYQAELGAAEAYTLPAPGSIQTQDLSQGGEISERLIFPKNPLTR